MNTQCQASVRAMPYEIVFGIKPSSEPVSDLTVINEGKGDEGPTFDSDSDDVEDGCKVPDSDNDEDGDDKIKQRIPAGNSSVVTYQSIYLRLCI